MDMLQALNRVSAPTTRAAAAATVTLPRVTGDPCLHLHWFQHSGPYFKDVEDGSFKSKCVVCVRMRGDAASARVTVLLAGACLRALTLPATLPAPTVTAISGYRCVMDLV